MHIAKVFGILTVAAALAAPVGFRSFPASAQTTASPESMQAAEELFELLSKDMLNQLTVQMTSTFWPLIERQLQGKADAATLVELRKEFERIQLDNLGAALKDAPPIYARNFTAPELRELTAFYRTAIGQKTLRVLPAVMAEFIQGMLPRMQDVQLKTQQSFDKVLRDRGYTK